MREGVQFSLGYYKQFRIVYILIFFCYTTYYMVSLFPQLLDYGFLATAVLRITLGLTFVWFARRAFFSQKREYTAFLENIGLKPAIIFFFIVAGVELILGVLLVIGLFTQAVALAISVITLCVAFLKWRRPHLLFHNTPHFYLLLAVVSFVLIFLGPGAIAFDFPL